MGKIVWRRESLKGSEKWGKGKQVKMNERKRKRETDAENGSWRNHNMLTVRQKHKRWISGWEIRREKGREYDAVEMERYCKTEKWSQQSYKLQRDKEDKAANLILNEISASLATGNIVNIQLKK